MSFEKPWGNYLLEAIVETKAPDTISFWPQTLAWQIILILLILFIIKKSYQSWKNYQANAYRREALAWLEQCSLINEDDVRQLPALIRKTAMLANQRLLHENRHITRSVYANINNDITNKTSTQTSDKAGVINYRHEISHLNGQSWVVWLDQHCSKSDFTAKESLLSTNTYSCEKLLSQLAYVPTVDLSNRELSQGLVKLKQQIKLWVTFHELGANLSAKPKSQPKQAPSGETT